MSHDITDTFERTSPEGPAITGLNITGLSALWPVLVMSLALLAGCKSTSKVAEKPDPFLPTRTVAAPLAQPLLTAHAARGKNTPAQTATASVKQDSQVLLISHQPELSEPVVP